MFEIILSLLFITLIIILSGLLLIDNFLKTKINDYQLYEVGLLGIFFYTFLSFLIHFFFPLNNTILSIFLIFILTLSMKKNFWEYLKLNFKNDKLFLGISFLIIYIMTLKYNLNEDYGYYHLPYIINLISEKIIFGLSNLQVNFAWNSSWLNFSAMLNLPFLGLKFTQLSNSILLFFIILMFLKKIFIKNIIKNNFSYFFIFILSCYVIIKFSRLKEHGFDFPANILFLITIYYFIKIFENYNNKNFIILILLSSLCVTIKLTTFALCIITISALYILIFKRNDFKFVLPSLYFAILLLGMWCLQQTIYSGCIVAFVESTCFDFSWHNQKISDAVSGATGAVNKSYAQYTGTLKADEYVKNFNWVSTWYDRNKTELFEHFAAIIIPIIIIIIFNFKKINIKSINNDLVPNNYLLCIIFFTSIFGLVVWFLKSPVIRFGIPYLFLIIFLLSFFILKYINILNSEKLIRSCKIILIIAILFNVSKNLNRINETDTKTYWPEILNVKYSTNKNGNFIVNYPNNENDSYHQRRYCWSIPFICHMNKGVNLSIQKKFNYLFIIEN